MLVWNVPGCINFLVQMDPDMVASYREFERAMIHGRPWATTGFAVAAFCGALGCLMLLLKKTASFYFHCFINWRADSNNSLCQVKY